MLIMSDQGALESAPPREQFDFARTSCGCAMCQVYCRHVPGRLTPPDLDRLVPPGADVFTWAETHLRAATDQDYPKLIPAQRADGSCHWYDQGRCAVHTVAPFGCAFFDAHMPLDEVRQRSIAASQACREDRAADGLYARLWRHLRDLGLTVSLADRGAVDAEMKRLRQAYAWSER
jgi:hypothetical protein